jgi:hypothetical protein
MSVDLTYKNHAPWQRILATANDADGPIDLTGCTIEVKLISATVSLTLALGSGVGVDNAVVGEYHYDVTPANLVALGLPSQITTTFNIWDANNMLVLSDTGVFAVTP